MSIRSLGVLGSQEQGLTGAAGTAVPMSAAPGTAPGSLAGLEAAVPSEVIALYTAIIAGCEAVLAEDAAGGYLPFRVVVYAIGLAGTALAAALQLPPSTSAAPSATTSGSRWIAGTIHRLRRQRILGSPSWLAAVLAFASWGLVLPGSFLYVWLSASLLSLTVVTVTALATFVLAVVLAPRIGRPRGGLPTRPYRSLPPMTSPPGRPSTMSGPP
jgi:hypothetical protein